MLSVVAPLMHPQPSINDLDQNPTPVDKCVKLVIVLTPELNSKRNIFWSKYCNKISVNMVRVNNYCGLTYEEENWSWQKTLHRLDDVILLCTVICECIVMEWKERKSFKKVTTKQFYSFGHLLLLIHKLVLLWTLSFTELILFKVWRVYCRTILTRIVGTKANRRKVSSTIVIKQIPLEKMTLEKSY